MKKIHEFLKRIYSDVIQDESDAIIVVVGDEGTGKSTLMLENVWLWQQIRGHEPTIDSVLDRVVHDDRTLLRQQLYESAKGDAHVAMDAAHVLFSKEAMHGEQIEIEKRLLDIRILGYFIQLGYQDWGHVTDHLARRRAKWVFQIPRRGVVWGYSREAIDEKYTNGSWPDPDMKDTFPALDGTDLWDEFKRRDEEKKRERLKIEEPLDIDDARWEEQVKIALRAVKPWDDDRGMSQRDAAALIDYSRGWISNRVQEWERGDHEDLLADEEMPNRATAAA